MAKNTFYDVLQISRNADPQIIKAAYKSLVQRYHPDKNPDNPGAEKTLKIINRAYEVLSDPVKRTGYDAALAEDDGDQISQADVATPSNEPKKSQTASRAGNDAHLNKATERAAPFDRGATLTKKRDYLAMLDLLPMAATADFFKSLVLTGFHGSPEVSGWAVFLSMLLGGAVGYPLCHYARTQITKNVQNRRTVIFLSLSISLGLTLAILTTTVLLSAKNTNPYSDPNYGANLVPKNANPLDDPNFGKQAPKPREENYSTEPAPSVSRGTAPKPMKENYSTEPDPSASRIRALQQTKALADQGDSEAQRNLGAAYATGQDVPQDYQEAFKWYRLSAAQGNPDAQYNLGNMYAHGRGVPKNYEQAVQWYLKAAEQGNSMAQFELGMSYYDGEGVQRDHVQAMKWLILAKANGTNGGQFLQQLESVSTQAQRAEAQRIVREWWAAHPQKN